ncbi:hypothetical protein KCP70_08155 [Salmonella enterica subsp. enterica]|nr:hypothetical protein KCP70_08155 [Salmonella enterica subsp. enterica]
MSWINQVYVVLKWRRSRISRMRRYTLTAAKFTHSAEGGICMPPLTAIDKLLRRRLT